MGRHYDFHERPTISRPVAFAHFSMSAVSHTRPVASSAADFGNSRFSPCFGGALRVQGTDTVSPNGCTARLGQSARTVWAGDSEQECHPWISSLIRPKSIWWRCRQMDPRCLLRWSWTNHGRQLFLERVDLLLGTKKGAEVASKSYAFEPMRVGPSRLTGVGGRRELRDWRGEFLGDSLRSLCQNRSTGSQRNDNKSPDCSDDRRPHTATSPMFACLANQKLSCGGCR